LSYVLVIDRSLINQFFLISHFLVHQAAPLLSAQNGTKSPQKTQTNGDATPTADNTETEVSNQVIDGPQQASHVVIDEKKKKNCRCCVIQ
jgi:hypothetical protein